MQSKSAGIEAAGSIRTAPSSRLLQTAGVAVVAATALVLVGCANAYDSYDDCCVPCQYCPPAPLPYDGYCGSPCHSKAAEPYLASSTTRLINPAAPLGSEGAATRTAQ